MTDEKSDQPLPTGDDGTTSNSDEAPTPEPAEEADPKPKGGRFRDFGDGEATGVGIESKSIGEEFIGQLKGIFGKIDTPKILIPELYQIDPTPIPSYDFELDDSPQRTADAAERMAAHTEALLEAMRQSVKLNEETREASNRIELFTRRMSVASLLISIASLLAAVAAIVVSVVLGNAGNGATTPTPTSTSSLTPTPTPTPTPMPSETPSPEPTP